MVADGIAIIKLVRHGDIMPQQYDIVWVYLLMEEIIQNSQDRNIPSADSIYSLVNFHIPMENHHAIYGKIRYFYDHFQ